MSDLSRLRARWIRLERRIAKLELERADDSLDAHEVADLTQKIDSAYDKLRLTIEQTGTEERRLIAADTKLRFTNV